MYFVYILRCCDDSLYTGITTCVERRLLEHNTSNKGAKYTRGRRPVVLEYFEEHNDRSSACTREYEIKKKMSRLEKLKLFNN